MDEIVNKSPSLRAAWERLEAEGWTVVKGPKGAGSRTDHEGKRIIIDAAQAKDDPRKFAVLFSHEVGHALNPPPPDIPASGLSRDDFIDKNTTQALDDEGMAALENALHRDEIIAGDLGFDGKLDAQYQAIYDAYNEGLSGAKGTTYRDEIRRRAEEEWARQHAASSG